MGDWLENFPDFKRVQEFASASTYGTVGFSRERFSFVYDLHVRNVSEYFKGRSNDLLLLDICGGEGWEALLISWCCSSCLPFSESQRMDALVATGR